MRLKQNIEQGFYSGGVFHPIRASADYDTARAGDDYDWRNKTTLGSKSMRQRLKKNSSETQWLGHNLEQIIEKARQVGQTEFYIPEQFFGDAHVWVLNHGGRIENHGGRINLVLPENELLSNPSQFHVVEIQPNVWGVFLRKWLLKKFKTRVGAEKYLREMQAKTNPFEQSPLVPVPVKTSNRYQKHFRKLPGGRKAGAMEFSEYRRRGLQINPEDLDEIFNLDNDDHDIIFADGTDDVIFADDDELAEILNETDLIENGIFGDAIKRRVNRYRAGRALKQQLKYSDRADRAKARLAELTKNPSDEILELRIGHYGGNLVSTKLNLKGQGITLYNDGKSHLRGLKTYKVTDKALAKLEQRFKVVYQNPAWLTNATNALVGLASAAQLREHIQKQKRKTKNVNTRAKKNPHGDIFQEFTGREATTTTEMPVSHLAPQRLDKLGDLVEVRLTDGRKLQFNPNSRKNKVWLTAANKRKMWIVGTRIAKPNPELADNQIEEIGTIDKVVYHEFKPIVGDKKPEFYIHELGEWSGEKPILAADKDGFPVIHGGAYEITSAGIKD
jgi:hypothetical protein